jgi:cyanate lyase
MLQTLVTSNARERLTDKVLESKASKGLSWQDLTEGTGLSLVFLTAALLGQHPISQEAAKVVCRRLELDDEAVGLLQQVPLRGSIPGGVPSDPTVYRFYEMIQIYGTTLKSLVHEMFGDGIVSAINFKMDIQKVSDPEGGERAIITLNGKFLPIKPF